MDKTLHEALDKIHAEQELKDSTMAYLQAQMHKRQRPARHMLRFAMAMVVIAVLAFSGLASYQLYAAPSSYIDLDVNPSIELTLNRFGRVLSAQAYNGDGETLLQSLNLHHMECDDAARLLLEAMIDQGYLMDGLISVTVQGSAEQTLAESLQDIMNTVLFEHHASVNTEVSVISHEIKVESHNHHLSPARYLAIQELQEVDPTATFEGCAGEGLGELRDQTRHGTGHHESAEENSSDPSPQNSNDQKQHHRQEHDDN